MTSFLFKWVNEPFPGGIPGLPWWSHITAMEQESWLTWSSAPSGGQCHWLFPLLCWFFFFSPLPGDLDSFKKNPFVLKEGVEYRIKINFKVRVWSLSLFVVSACRRHVTAAALSYICPGNLLSKMMCVSSCRSTRRLCRAWSTFNNHSGKELKV